MALKIAAAVAAALAVYRAVTFEMPVLTSAPAEAGGTYLGQPAPAAAIIILAALVAAVVTISCEVRPIAISVALLVAANLAAFTLDPGLAVAVWSGLAFFRRMVAATTHPWIQRHLSRDSGVLLATGAAVTLITIAPPSRLLVTAGATVDHPFLWSTATLALASLSAAVFIMAWGMRTPASGWLALGGGVLALYLVSVGIVDEFQRHVNGAANVAELRWQSQVALSFVWAILGGSVVVAGLFRDLALLRSDRTRTPRSRYLQSLPL